MESTMLPFLPETFMLTGYPANQTSMPQYANLITPPRRVLFLCAQNNARSQMAEALLRHLSNDTIEAYSAGSYPSARVHPLARRAMETVGITMLEQYPKHFARYCDQEFDVIVTLCDRIQEICPNFPNNPKYIHWSIPDPVASPESDEEQYALFQQIGLQLTTRLRLLITVLNRKHTENGPSLPRR